MRRHEANKALLEGFSLEQLQELCREHKREMHRLDYLDRVVIGETEPEIIKKRFIPYVAGFFSEGEILDFAKRHGIRIA
ncbi:MAG: hypothetical protein KGI33_02130 [Thaumarchaeota archaeon]|nr:hypothetical protein [Nitrososphaerota archaeon]